MTDQNPKLLIGVLGILKSGHGFVPIDPDLPNERIEFVLNDCRIAILITEEKYLAKALHLAEHSSFLKHVICLDEIGQPIAPHDGVELHPYDDCAAQKASAESVHVEADELVYVIYTSGSTGTPKGVPISHRNLVPLLDWSREYFHFGEQTKTLQNLSHCFDFGVFELLTTLLFGGTMYFLDKNELTSSSRYADYVNEQGINTIHSTPSLFREILSRGGKFEPLEVLHLGGEPLTGSTIDEISRIVGDGCVLYNGYGPTEATINCSIFEVGRQSACDSWVVTRIPIGKASANNSLCVLDKNWEPVPIGVPGQLHVGGAGLTRGYLNRPELTAEKFMPNPFSREPGARLYKTGDLVRCRPDGNLEFLGRLDYQVKVRGFRIELREIEAVLAQHPAVHETVVMAREDSPGDKRLVAYVVAKPEEPPTMSELRHFVQAKLPDYMVPSAFVLLETWPLTPNGKLDRRALPVPDRIRPELEETFVAPRTPIEEAVAGIWADVLGLERIGVHDTFFGLGGHSILATQMIARVRDAFQVELPMRCLFEMPTVAGLAENVRRGSRSESSLKLPPIQPVARNRELPLSFAQERIWFLSQLAPDSTAYHVPRAVRMKGRLSVSAVHWAFTELIRRHEVLRTTFPTGDGRPRQVIHPPQPITIPVVDLRLLPETEREAEVQRLIIGEGQQPFDLAKGPLLRLKLLRLDEEEHVLILVEHHLVHDGWAQGVLIRDFSKLYAASAAGKPSPLPELPIQFADFAYWQRQWLQGDVLEAELSFWRRQLAGAPPVLELPTDRPRPAVQSFRGVERIVTLPARLSESLRTLSRREGVTLFMTMLAAFKTLLYHYAAQEDIVVGSVIANRRLQEIEGLLGMILNTVVLRTDLSGNPPVRELLGRVREACLGAYAHQDLPFEKLVEAIQPERHLSHTPIFQVMFSFMDVPHPDLELPGLTLEVLESHNRSAKFDIGVIVLPHWEQRISSGAQAQASEITILLEYNTDLFDDATMTRMLEHYQGLLEGIVADPTRRLLELPLLTSVQRQQLLVDWNNTEIEFPQEQDQCLHQFFEAQVERSPDHVAVIFEDQQMTYRELNRRANQLAHYLRALGVGPEVLVGICLERSLEMVVAILGVLKAGGAYVPLDPAYPSERVAFMLEDTQAPVLLTQRRLVEKLPPSGAQQLCLDWQWEVIAQASAGPPVGVVAPDNVAYVIYTSGSTGRPKGVAIQHSSAATLLNWAGEVFTAEDVAGVLASTSICFDLSVFELFVPLSRGGAVILVENALHLPSAASAHHVTLINTVPSALAELMRGDGLPGSVRTVNLAGEPLPNTLAQQIYQQETVQRVFNLYGPSEDTTYSTVALIEKGAGGPPPIGRPIANTKIYLLNAHRQPVPIGVPGELYIGGAGLARGYLHRPELTAEKFIPNHFSEEPGARLYKTGDLARYRLDGNIEFLGRCDHQVKLRGFRIELGEIETVLSRHPALQEAVVVVREDAPGERRLVAYLVANPESVASTDELLSFLKKELPEYMLPSAFVQLETLPLTANGKVDRRALPAPQGRDRYIEKAFVAPRTPIEQMLAEIWCDVLRLERVGVHDDFFQLGGHSLLATRIVSRVQDIYRIALPLRRLFETPTVAGLAMAVTQSQNGDQESERLDRILREIETLSDDEVEAALYREIPPIGQGELV
jgi:amino acid adenylation domain-containing protein